MPGVNPFDPWGSSMAAWKGMRDSSMEAWSKAMIDFVNSEAYSQATAQALDTYLTVSQPFQKVVETTMTRVLTQLNMPTRGDVISLAQRLTNIELRIDDLDARFDELQRMVRQAGQGGQPGQGGGQSRQGRGGRGAARAAGRGGRAGPGEHLAEGEDATGAADAVDTATPDKDKGL
jgi:hypothetical protein